MNDFNYYYYLNEGTVVPIVKITLIPDDKESEDMLNDTLGVLMNCLEIAEMIGGNIVEIEETEYWQLQEEVEWSATIVLRFPNWDFIQFYWFLLRAVNII